MWLVARMIEYSGCDPMGPASSKFLTLPNFPVEFTVGDESPKAGITGGPLSGSYTLNSFRLHWGSTSGQGSEHTINGHRLVKGCA